MTRAAARLYLRPMGLVRDGPARELIGAGAALPLGGADVGYLAGELLERGRDGIEQRVLGAAGLREAARSDRPALRDLLARIALPPPWPEAVREERPAIMGVVNVTPDSFSDGGRFFARDAAVAQGLRLWEEGAALVDVGGESTRPGAHPVSVDEEIGRVVPVIEALASAGVVVSIDTRKAAVLRAALDAGAALINDVSALEHDPESLPVAAASGRPVVLMHCRGDPATMQRDPVYERACLDVYDYLEARIEACVAAGIPRARLIADPGIGFGKTVEHNLDILRHLGIYRALGVPILLGVSRKSFIARLSGGEPADRRLPGSLAAALFGIINEVSIIRVHDVSEMRQAWRVWSAMMREQTGIN